MQNILRHNINQFNVSESLAKLLVQETADERLSNVHVAADNCGGLQMTVNGEALYPAQTPVLHAASDIQKLSGNKKQNAVAYFGLGFGIHLEFLVRRFDAPVVIYEPDLAVLRTTLGSRPFSLERVFIEHRFGDFMARLERLLTGTDLEIVAAAMPGYRQRYPQAYERFEFAVKQTLINVRVSENTLNKGEVWCEYELTNLPMVARLPGAAALSKWMPKRIPGIVVAAGPSLEKNIHILKDLRDTCLIISVNSALRPLEQAGVTPHIVAFIESNDSRDHFDNIDCLKNVVIAPTTNAFPAMYHLKARGIAPIVQTPSPVADWMCKAYPETPTVKAGGSVSLVAFSLLHALECDPIVFVGLDLAFADGKTHVSGADESKVRYVFNDAAQRLDFFVGAPSSNDQTESVDAPRYKPLQVSWITAWGGEGTVMSSDAFNNYRSWLEVAVDTWASDRTVINATEGGARINGLREMTLKESMRRFFLQPFDVDDCIEKLLNQPLCENQAPLKQVLQAEMTLLQDIRDNASLCHRNAARIRDKLNRRQLKQASALLETFAVAEKKVGEMTRHSPTLVQMTQAAADRFRRERLQDVCDDPVEQTCRSLDRSQKLFAAISRSAATLERMLGRAVSP